MKNLKIQTTQTMGTSGEHVTSFLKLTAGLHFLMHENDQFKYVDFITDK